MITARTMDEARPNTTGQPIPPGPLPLHAERTEGLGDTELVWCRHGSGRMVACIVVTQLLTPEMVAVLQDAADRVQAMLAAQAAPPKPPLSILP